MRARSSVGETSTRVQLLGVPTLQLASGTEAALSPKDAALLAILIVEGTVARSRLASMVWPNADPAGARNNLRQRLFRLHRAAGRDVVSQGETMALAHGIEHDLVDPAAALEGDAAAVTGVPLGALDYDADPELARWVDGVRETWRNTLRDRLAGLAARCESENRIADALLYAERLATQEPLLEHAQRQLMRLHYRRGDRGAALAVYERLRAALDRELGETASAETQQLAALIEASLELPVAAPPPTPVALLRPPRLIARDDEWRAMHSAWSRSIPILLTGEPGIGKSRLLADFADAHSVTARVQARPGDAAVPYAVLARLLRVLFRLGTASPSPALAAALDAGVRSELARIAPEFGDAGAGQFNAARFRGAVEHALRQSGASAASIDDLQFADEATLDLLTRGLVQDSGLRWLFAARRAELPDAVRAWAGSASSDDLVLIDLGPLDVAGVRSLVESVAEGDAPMAHLADALHRHSGGSPLFLLQTLLEWLRHGRRAPDADQPLPYPTDVLRLIQRRLDTLPDDALKLARIAALAGPDFEVDLAAAVLGRHPLDLLAGWKELERALVIDEHAFVHDLVREACAAAVPQPIRIWLHRRLAQWLAAERPATPPARLAAHWALGGDAAAAGEAWLRAAAQSRAAGRTGEECRALRSAADAFAGAGLQAERFGALALLVIAARESLAPAQAMAVAEELLACSQGAAQRGTALKELAGCHMHAMRYEAAAPLLQEAITLLRDSGDANQAGHAQYLWGLTTARTHGPARAVAELEALIPWAERQTDESQRQCFYVDLAIALDQSDQRQRARPLFETAIAHFERTGESGDLAINLMMLGRNLIQLGELAGGTRHLERATTLRAQLSEGSGGQGLEALNLARAWIEGGRYDAALELLDPLIARLDAPATALVCAAARQALARLLALLGRPEQVLRALGAPPAGLPPHQQAQALWTEALTLHDRAAERSRLLTRAVACFEDGDLPFVRLPIEFDQLAAVGDAASLERCEALIAECEPRQLPAAQLLGRARRVQLLAATGAGSTEAAREIKRLLDALQHLTPVGAYLPEMMWVCARAASEAGDAGLAERCRASGRQWIDETALPHVPQQFRASFLERNPFNRGLRLAR